MAFIAGGIPKVRTIGGLPFLDSDVPGNAGSLESRGFWGLHKRYKAAIQQATETPGIWVACPVRFKGSRRFLQALRIAVRPQWWVILDPATRRFVFVDDDRLNDARQGKFHSKFQVVRPNAVC